MRALNTSVSDHWLFVGDFNFYRSSEDRNKPGGNLNDTLIFNDIIGHLGLEEIPLKRRAFTSSNMQHSPLLEQLDWFFTIVNWTSSFPNTLALPLAKTTSDHVPCKISIGTTIPRSNIFRFKNFWPEHPGFFEVVQAAWSKPINRTDIASVLSAKFKALSYDLKYWSKKLSNLSLLIDKCNKIIFFMDCLEECRDLTISEWNFRVVMKIHLSTLLKYKKLYWQKRHTVNRIRFGDECTKFFHAMATVNYRRNTIPSLRDEYGNFITDHEGKLHFFTLLLRAEWEFLVSLKCSLICLL